LKKRGLLIEDWYSGGVVWWYYLRRLHWCIGYDVIHLTLWCTLWPLFKLMEGGKSSFSSSITTILLLRCDCDLIVEASDGIGRRSTIYLLLQTIVGDSIGMLLEGMYCWYCLTTLLLWRGVTVLTILLYWPFLFHYLSYYNCERGRRNCVLAEEQLCVCSVWRREEQRNMYCNPVTITNQFHCGSVKKKRNGLCVSEPYYYYQ